MDQVLLPVVGMLGGLSLLLMERLPQDLVVQEVAGSQLDLAQLQLLWLCVAIGLLGAIAVLVRQDGWLRYYRYTWAAAGIGLLLLVFVLGDEVNGARLSITVGPFTGQPSELLKVILVVFLAAYLADNRTLLAAQSRRVGPFNLPPLPYLLPMLAMWGIALAVVIVQKDLGAALLFFTVFLVAAVRGDAARLVRGARPRAVPRRRVGAVPGLRSRAVARRHVARPVRRPAGRRLPDHPGALRVRPRRRAGHRARRRDCRRWGACRRSPRSTPTSSSRHSRRSSACSAASRSAGLYLVIARARAAHRGPGR